MKNAMNATPLSPRFPLARLIVGLALLACVRLSAADILVPLGSTWKYRDNGSDQGTAWRAVAFDDSTWASGPAELGYGDGGEATVVSFGPDSANKYITTYFRRTFTVANPSVYLAASVTVRRDDGAVVYLNGVEIARGNMPAGTPAYNTLASAAIEDTTDLPVSVNPALLVAGANVLAVEIHQAAVTSSDISFDLQFSASTTLPQPTVTRGPYLQLGGPNEITVRWRTDIATDSRVCVGTVQGTLSTCVDDAAVTTEHVVRVTGLSADTRYYYSVGSTTATLAGNDANHFFLTAPPAGTAKPTRIWVLGDAGLGTAAQASVRDAYYNFTGARHTDLWMMLGDNAYSTGTDAEFQAKMFNVYPAMLRKSVLWSTRGNHESTDAAGSVYYGLHTFPTAGQFGGVASGTEKYYSFDYGNIHFICLDSYGSSRSATGPMATWLGQDLAANLRPWVIAFWHHPPYTKGSHNSDTEVELIEMRQNILPILENAGVDLVLCGHSHSYERSYLLDGHYGGSTTLTTSMKKDGGSGRTDGTGAYLKPTAGMAPHEGAVYVVAGSSGQTSGGTLNHPAMFISLNNLGSVVLDFDGNRLDAKFIRENGVTADYFTILKGTGSQPPATPAGVVASAGDTQVGVRWRASTGATGYNVKRAATSGGPYTTLAAGVTTTNYLDTGLVNGTPYYYVVSAFNTAGESANSSQVTATPQPPQPPAAPTALAATAGKGRISLKWTQSATPGTRSNIIYRATSSAGPFAILAAVTPRTTYTDTVAKGLTRYYRVSALNTNGLESLPSNTAFATSK
ncbi:MAG: hypothetical protein RJA22_284 [Verrucomicrobiota bacterium]